MARKPPETPKDPNALNEVEDRFVTEFMVDRDPRMAALRTGVSNVALKGTLKKWMSDPRIIRAIQDRTDGMDIERMISPQRIVAGFMDLAFDKTAPHSARKGALQELANIKKMYEDPEKDSQGSGVVLIPVAGSLDDWKAMALNAQQKLKDDVRG